MERKCCKLTDSNFVDVGKFKSYKKGQKGITVMCWFKSTNLSSDFHIVRLLYKKTKVNQGGGWSDRVITIITKGWSIFYFQGKLRVELQNDNKVIIDNFSNFEEKKFNHVAFTYDGKKVVVYSNGKKLSEEGVFSGSIEITEKLNFGKNDKHGLILEGSICEVKIFKINLSKNEVVKQMGMFDEDVLESNHIIGYWTLNKTFINLVNGEEASSSANFVNCDFHKKFLEKNKKKEIIVFNKEISKKYEKLYNQKQHSDLLFKFEDGDQIYAHKIILSSNTTYFEDLKEIIIKTDEKKVFSQMIKLFYSNSFEYQNEKELIEVLLMLKKYDYLFMKDIKIKEMNYLNKIIEFANINKESFNEFEYLLTFFDFSLLSLQDFKSILKKNSFLNQSSIFLQQIVSSIFKIKLESFDLISSEEEEDLNSDNSENSESSDDEEYDWLENKEKWLESCNVNHYKNQSPKNILNNQIEFHFDKSLGFNPVNATTFEIIFNFKKYLSLKKFKIYMVGDTTHDIKDFELLVFSKSKNDFVSFFKGTCQSGTKSQLFDFKMVKGKRFKWKVLSVHSQYQPWVCQVQFFAKLE
jgi:hypothetical protein